MKVDGRLEKWGLIGNSVAGDIYDSNEGFENGKTIRTSFVMNKNPEDLVEGEYLLTTDSIYLLGKSAKDWWAERKAEDNKKAGVPNEN